MARRLTVEAMSQLPVRTFGPGGKGAPETWITFGVHGNETQSVNIGEEVALGGLEVVRKGLHVERGIVKVGFGNPEAIAQNLRSTDKRVNLNRMWKPRADFTTAETGSSEDLRARVIDSLVLSPATADTDDRVLADMHGTSNPAATPFAIAEPGLAEELASKFDVTIVTSGFDEVEPGGLDHGANQVDGMVGICLETGYNGDEASGDRIRRAIEALITDRHTDREAIIRASRRVKVIDLFHGRTDQPFVYARTFPDFGHVGVDEPFGHFEGEEDQPLRVRDASLGVVDRMAAEDGLTSVATMFAGAAGGIKPAGMEMGLFGVEGPKFDSVPAPVQQ